MRKFIQLLASISGFFSPSRRKEKKKKLREGGNDDLSTEIQTMSARSGKSVTVCCFLKSKLMPIDNALPFLMQAAQAGLIGRLDLVFYDQDMPQLIASNPAIAEAIDRIGAEIVCLPPTGDSITGEKIGLVRRLRGYVETVWKLRSYLTGKVLTLGGPLGSFAARLALINKRLFGGTHLEFRLLPYSEDTLRCFSNIMSGQYGRRRYTMKLPSCDAVLSSFEKDELLSFGQIVGNQAVPMIKVGYARGFPAWRRYIGETAGRHIEPTVRAPLLFWPLSVLYREEPSGEIIDLRGHILDTMRVLKSFEGRLQTVFRYHPTTDRAQFQSLLEEAGLTDYAISDAHPHQLIERAALTFSNAGSSLFCDAYFLGCPVVQFINRSPVHALLDEVGEPVASLYRPDVDHFIVDDPDAFAAVLEDILARGRAAVRRDPDDLARRFPVLSDDGIRALLRPYL